MFRRIFTRSYSTASFPFTTWQKNKDKKQLILSILKQTATKRETNTYLNKYSACLDGDEVILNPPKRYMVIKIEGDFNQYDAGKLMRFNKTLDNIIKLGGHPIIVLDSDHLISNDFKHNENYLFDQFNKFNSFTQSSQLQLLPLRSSLYKDYDDSIRLQSSLLGNLDSFNKIPVLFPILYNSNDSKESLLPSTQFLVNFIKEFQSSFTNTDSTIEKIIFIDKFGGIPSLKRSNNSHVFINLKQEYQLILDELDSNDSYPKTHSNNLKSMNEILNVVKNETSTGLITTLDIAIESLDLNPIIYNILTDRSLVSSSLSPVKFKSNNKLLSKIAKTTIIKKGIDLKTFENMDEIDLVKFKKLIDDSFRRSLNLDHYLNRINGKISQIIIIGDYEGIAIITNETSSITGQTYPYLDKFAVLRSKQGSLGVADIIFNKMLDNYEGEFLLWRSKKINPVNGWYFQRSNGSFDMIDSEFRLFWNGLDRKFDAQRLESFIDIAKNIEPSWDK